MYPEHGDSGFAGKLMRLAEYQTFKVTALRVIKDEQEFNDETEKVCSSFDKLHQHFVEHYLSQRSPYRSILLYHSLGVGKTCSAITVAEAMLQGHVASEGPRILVISSTALHKSFHEQVIGECTDDFYQALGHGDKKRMKDLVKSRYKFITYEGIINYAKECGDVIENKTIIVDEAHNLRTEDKRKESSEVLEKLISKNAKKGNRLILLSATPMYDKPLEITWLLSLLMQNDGMKPLNLKTIFDAQNQLTPKARSILEKLSGEYISYIKSKNPFAFAHRLSPEASGIPVLKDDWASDIPDGLVTTPEGDLQVVTDTDYQNANITYPGEHKPKKGKKPKKAATATAAQEDDVDTVDKSGEGLFRIFSRNSSNHFSLSYMPAHNNSLMPTPDNLGRIAAKMQRICDFIRSSKGIVLVYSRYIPSGVIPLAIALEHMGLQRYGQPNILNRPDLVSDSVRATQKYCILSGDKNVMGTSTIPGCLSTINSAKNANGEKVKVVLITQVAGEGLTLKNIREVHIMEPWFNMNRIDQVVGRAIRTCVHKGLPLSDRNVTVFLHAIDNPAGADMHVYRTFVATKLAESKQIEALIKHNALDCDVMQNMNFYGKSKFPFVVKMKTSQGETVTVQLGDDGPEPVCSTSVDKIDRSTFMMDTFKHLIPLATKRMFRSLLKSKSKWMSISELERRCGLDDDIVKAAIPHMIYPNIVVAGYRIYAHTLGKTVGLVLEHDVSRSLPVPPMKIRLPTKLIAEEETQAESLLDQIPMHDPVVAIYSMYTFVNADTWDAFAQHVITKKHPLALMDFTRRHGVFVYANELNVGGRGIVVGYVNIFNSKDFTVSLEDKGVFRPADANEIAIILGNRREVWTPNDVQNNTEVLGMFVPEIRTGSDIAQNKFKIVKVESKKGKSGIVCTYITESILKNMLTDLMGKEVDISLKAPLCAKLGFELMRRDRVLTYPRWKPRNN